MIGCEVLPSNAMLCVPIYITTTYSKQRCLTIQITILINIKSPTRIVVKTSEMPDRKIIHLVHVHIT